MALDEEAKDELTRKLRLLAEATSDDEISELAQALIDEAGSIQRNVDFKNLGERSVGILVVELSNHGSTKNIFLGEFDVTPMLGALEEAKLDLWSKARAIEFAKEMGDFSELAEGAAAQIGKAISGEDEH